jgi:hypothetical protein
MSNEIKNRIEEVLYNYYKEADKENINDELREEIPDIDAYELKKKKTINRLHFIAKATSNQKRDEQLLTIAKEFQSAIEKNIEKPVTILKQIISGHSALVLNKGLDKLSKEEIIEIIKDKNLVELLEQLERSK